jgi:hypothetical protein
VPWIELVNLEQVDMTFKAIQMTKKLDGQTAAFDGFAQLVRNASGWGSC